MGTPSSWRRRMGASLVAALIGVTVAGCAGAGDPAGETERTTGRTSDPVTTTHRTPKPRSRRPTGLRGTVTDVVDGDTIKVESRGFETVVRLVGIDTPETRKPGSPVECHGPQATLAAERLLPVGRSVRLETDPTQAQRDRYGRLLAYVYVAGRTGATGSVNYRLVAQGHARAYVYGGVPFRYAGRFQAAQDRARALGLGLWGPPCDGERVSAAAGGRASLVSIPEQPRSAAGAGCDPNYRGACVPPYPPDVDCADIGRIAVTVVGTDPHGLDGDGDGRGCE